MQYKIGDTVLYKAPDGQEYQALVVGREIYFDKNFIDLQYTSGHFDYLVEYTLQNGCSTTAFCQERNLAAGRLLPQTMQT